MEQGKPWFYPTFFRRLRGWGSGVVALPGVPFAAAQCCLSGSRRPSIEDHKKYGRCWLAAPADFTLWCSKLYLPLYLLAFVTGRRCRIRTRYRAVPKFFLPTFSFKKK